MDTLVWTVISYGLNALQVFADHIHELVLALAGTFVGAYLAFRLERSDRQRKLLEARNAEGNLALFALFQMWNVLYQYKTDVIDVAPKGEDKWLNMAVTPPYAHENLAFNASALHFLLEGKDNNLISQLFLEQRRYYAAIELINRRSHLHLEKIFPRLTAAGIELNKQYDERVIIGAVGIDNVLVARNLANSLTKNVIEDLASFRDTFERLRTQLRELLPGRKFIQVDFGSLTANKTQPDRPNGNGSS